MLFRRTRGLLGLGINPAMKATANTALINDKSGNSGGTTYSDEHAGTFTINQHTWAQIAEEFLGYPLKDWGTAAATAAVEAQVTRVSNAINAEFPACPPDWQVGAGFGCRGYAKGGPALYTLPSLPIEFLPVGTFAIEGVPFTPNEVKDGKFIRTITPGAAQRAQIEIDAIYHSTERLFGGNGVNWIRRKAFGTGAGLISAAGRIWGAVMTKFIEGLYGDTRRIEALSVDEVLALCDDVMLYALNFERNPIQPSAAERSGKGGWVSWISRGGYPLSRRVITGRDPFHDSKNRGSDIIVYTGLQCGCQVPLGPYTGMSINLAGEFVILDKKGAYKPDPNNTTPRGEWSTYVEFPQDKINPVVQVSAVYQDPSKWEAIGVVGEKIMKEIAIALCANQNVAQATLSAKMAEKCTTPDGKACIKGTTNCKCVSPTQGQQAAVGLTEGAVALWCGAWAAENLPPPELPPLTPPPPPVPPSTTNWWLVGGLGLLGGIAASAFLAPPTTKK